MAMAASLSAVILVVAVVLGEIAGAGTAGAGAEMVTGPAEMIGIGAAVVAMPAEKQLKAATVLTWSSLELWCPAL